LAETSQSSALAAPDEWWGDILTAGCN
jgi:hypothetical protein